MVMKSVPIDDMNCIVFAIRGSQTVSLVALINSPFVDYWESREMLHEYYLRSILLRHISALLIHL